MNDHKRCPECDPIDLSDAADITEAVEIWNDHLREEHGADCTGNRDTTE